MAPPDVAAGKAEEVADSAAAAAAASADTGKTPDVAPKDADPTADGPAQETEVGLSAVKAAAARSNWRLAFRQVKQRLTELWASAAAGDAVRVRELLARGDSPTQPNPRKNGCVSLLLLLLLLLLLAYVWRVVSVFSPLPLSFFLARY